MLKQYQSYLKIYILNFFKGEGMKPNYRASRMSENIQMCRRIPTEERFMRALENGNGNNPDWYKGISWTTKKEDRKGIDFIVHTVFGNIFIQIKSSEAGAKKFLKKPRNLRILLLIIKREYQEEEEIRRISFTAIQTEIDLYKKPSC